MANPTSKGVSSQHSGECRATIYNVVNQEKRDRMGSGPRKHHQEAYGILRDLSGI